MNNGMTQSPYLAALQSSLRTSEEHDFIRQFIKDANITSKRQYVTNRLGLLLENLHDEEKWKHKPLYDHQREAIESTHNYFSNIENPPQTYTVIPTGGGKTEIFAHVVNSLAQEFRVGATNTFQRVTPPTIILVPTEDLVGQTVERFQKYFPNLQVGQYYGKKKEIRSTTVMVYNSFVDAVDQGFIKPEDVSALVMDEAHRGLSDFRQDVFDKFKDKSLMLAYTAILGDM